MSELFIPDRTFTDKVYAAMLRGGKLMLEAHDIAVSIESKAGDKNYFTSYDIAVQELMYRELKTILPDAGFIGEESEEHNTAQLSDRVCFIVDPIDGTNNFIACYRFSAISVAVADHGTLVAGYIYNPYSNEFFHAVKGGGTYLNDMPVSVSERPLCDGMVGFGTSPYKRELSERTFSVLRRIYPVSRDLRRSGSAALDIAYVACGRIEAFFEGELQPWDYAAGSVLVTEAGGVITDVLGNPLPLSRPSSVFASNLVCRDEAFDIIREY